MEGTVNARGTVHFAIQAPAPSSSRELGTGISPVRVRFDGEG